MMSRNSALLQKKMLFRTKRGLKGIKVGKTGRNSGLIDFSSQETINSKNLFKFNPKRTLVVNKENKAEGGDVGTSEVQEKQHIRMASLFSKVDLEEENRVSLEEVDEREGNPGLDSLVEKRKKNCPSNSNDSEDVYLKPKKVLERINLIEDEDVFSLSSYDGDYVDSSRKLNRIFENPKQTSSLFKEDRGSVHEQCEEKRGKLINLQPLAFNRSCSSPAASQKLSE